MQVEEGGMGTQPFLLGVSRADGNIFYVIQGLHKEIFPYSLLPPSKLLVGWKGMTLTAERPASAARSVA